MPIPVMTIDIAMTVRSEWKMDLGRMLAALRDTIPNNREYGAAVRKRFGLNNALEVAEMARVARRYGDRPEIFRNAGWRTWWKLARLEGWFQRLVKMEPA
jgi:hypothetical protein